MPQSLEARGFDIESKLEGKRKILVLDTSVLVGDPDSIWSFPGDDVVIPLTAIEELDRVYKTRDDAAGAAARSALRNLESIRNSSSSGSLNEAVTLENGGTLRVATNGLHLKEIAELGFDVKSGDNRILAAALGLQSEHKGQDDIVVVLVSADTGLRIKASQLKLIAVEYKRNADVNIHGNGWYEVGDAKELIDSLYEGDVTIFAKELIEYGLAAAPLENEFVALKGSPSGGALCVVKNGALVRIKDDVMPFGLHLRGHEQKFAMSALLDVNIPVVALVGEAGTGKTLLSVAAALEQCVEQSIYNGLSVYRPVIPAGGQDLGFLPGTLEEKLAVWGGPIQDALVVLGGGKDGKAGKNYHDEFLARGKLEFGSIAHARGRSIARRFVLIDEAQNLSPAEIKLLISRASEGTKIVLTGDHTQIDAKYLSARNNGLSAAVEAFKGDKNFAFIRLIKGERSEIANMAAKLL